MTNVATSRERVNESVAVERTNRKKNGWTDEWMNGMIKLFISIAYFICQEGSIG